MRRARPGPAVGGAVVDFDDLVDGTCTDWAVPLAATTGLDAGRLIEARNRRLSKRMRTPMPLLLDCSELSRLYWPIHARRNDLFPPP